MATQNPRKIRLAYIVSHPIQYQADLLRQIAQDPGIDLHVFFCSDFSARAYQDAGFGVSVEWDVPLLSGYRYTVLPRWRDTTNPGPLRPIARGILRGLRGGIHGQRFDAVWIHGYSTVNALHAIVAARLLGLPVLLRVESWLQDRARSGAKLFAKQIFFRLLRYTVSAVLPIGTQNAAYWRAYLGPACPQFLMPYAVNNHFFASRTADAAATRSALQTELNLDPARPVILFASKLQQRKHCDHLLDAYLALVAANPHTSPYLVIVGDGEMRTSLELRALSSRCEDIRFAGFRNQNQLPRFFDLATVFVLPSKHEAWGLIVNEAMAAGLPVVVSDNIGCVADIVRNGENGYVYPVGNIAALTAALQAVLQPGTAAAMGQRSRQLIAQWTFREDILGLRNALAHVTGLPLASQDAA